LEKLKKLFFFEEINNSQSLPTTNLNNIKEETNSKIKKKVKILFEKNNNGRIKFKMIIDIKYSNCIFFKFGSFIKIKYITKKIILKNRNRNKFILVIFKWLNHEVFESPLKFNKNNIVKKEMTIPYLIIKSFGIILFTEFLIVNAVFDLFKLDDRMFISKKNTIIELNK